MISSVTLGSNPAEHIAQLLDATPTATGWQACCPSHSDHTPSLSIAIGDDGKCLMHCHAGCDTHKILSALDLSWQDLFPGDGRRHRQNGRSPGSGDELSRQRGLFDAAWRDEHLLTVVARDQKGHEIEHYLPIGRLESDKSYVESALSDPIGGVFPRSGCTAEELLGAIIEEAESADSRAACGEYVPLQHKQSCGCSKCCPNQIDPYSVQLSNCISPIAVSKVHVGNGILRRIGVVCKCASCPSCHKNYLLQRSKKHLEKLLLRHLCGKTIYKYRTAKVSHDAMRKRVRRSGATGWIKCVDRKETATWYIDAPLHDSPLGSYERLTTAEALASACDDVDATPVGQRHLRASRNWGYTAIERQYPDPEDITADEGFAHFGQTMFSPVVEASFAQSCGLRRISDNDNGTVTWEAPSTWDEDDFRDYLSALNAELTSFYGNRSHHQIVLPAV